MTVHIPIMAEQIVESLVEPFLALPPSSEPHWILDATLGGGGHTAEFLKALQMNSQLINHKVLAIDQDEGAVERARKRFQVELEEGRLEIVHSRFSEIAPILKGRQILGMLADLGFSSDQLEDSSRGLSFLREGPLDMRLDPSRGISCYQYLQSVSERDLADLIFQYGEERFSRRIASSIVRSREEGRLPQTTTELADLVTRSVPPPARRGRIHAATRTFQALRIFLNDELDELDLFLKNVVPSLERGGRVAFLSFHSLEDRRVKLAFKDKASLFKPLFKKPLEADDAELSQNPRARSAKLRIAERIA